MIDVTAGHSLRGPRSKHCLTYGCKLIKLSWAVSLPGITSLSFVAFLGSSFALELRTHPLSQNADDALRPLLMPAGGLYLDSDVQGLKSTEYLLSGREVVL